MDLQELQQRALAARETTHTLGEITYRLRLPTSHEVLLAAHKAGVVGQAVGAAYLVWLGIQQWRAPVRPLVAPAGEASPDAHRHLARTLFLRGWMVNALNPKGTVFLIAVLPQFIDAARPLLAQYLAIGATFGVVECLVMSGYVALASRVLGKMNAYAAASGSLIGRRQAAEDLIDVAATPEDVAGIAW